MFTNRPALVLALSALAPLGPLSALPAQAADTLVVVESFDGPDSDRLRALVKKELEGLSGYAAVSDRKLASTEADLGLMQASDSYEAVARELKAAAFIKGSVAGGKKKPGATIEVRDAKGKLVGSESWKGANAKAVMASAEKGVGKALAKLLSKIGPATDGGAVAAAKPAPAVKAEPEEVKAKDSKPARKKKDEEEAGDRQASASADLSASVGPTREDDQRDPRNWKGLDASVGMLAYSRKFAYNELLRGPLQGYELPAAPAAVIAIDYFPIGLVGLTAGLEYTLPVVTSERQTAQGTDVFLTRSMGWHVGAKGKYHMDALELNLAATYGMFSFEVPGFEDGDVFVASNVSGVSYTQVRAVAGFRYDLGAFAITGGGGYIHLLGLGEIAKNFPGATGLAAEANLGAAFALPAGLEGRVSAVARQYGLTFMPIAEDANQAPGAYDRYLGLNLSVAYRYLN